MYVFLAFIHIQMYPIPQALQRRYATKAYDESKKISDTDLNTILESLRLAPSSFGVQAWKFLVVTDPTIREKLQAASWGQPQLTTASHIVVLLAKKDYTEKDVDTYMADIAATRWLDVAQLDWFKQAILGAISHRSQADKEIRNKKQTYIALGFGLLTAAHLGIDTTPMEGLDPKQYDEILWLTEWEYTTSVVLALWYRSPEDQTQHYKKVRYSADKVISFI